MANILQPAIHLRLIAAYFELTIYRCCYILKPNLQSKIDHLLVEV